MSPLELLRINWQALQAIVYKEIRRFLRIWVQTITPSAINSTLYLLIFGTLIGSRVGSMQGLPYMAYIIPGIAIMAVITNSFANVVSSFFSAKFQRHIEELLVAPVFTLTIIVGYVTGGVARAFLVGCAVLLVGALFGSFQMHSLSVTLGMFLLTATLFSLLGMLNGLVSKSFDDISIVPNFVLTPMTYLGGVFYSIDLLPPLWQTLSQFNPMLYLVNGFRYGLLGVSDVSPGTAFAMVALANVVALALVWSMLRRGAGLKH